MHSLIPLLVGSVTALVHNRTQDVLIRQHFVPHLNLTFVETKGWQRQTQPMEQVSEASQTPDMPSPKDFVSLIFGFLAFILAISIHWFNEERSAKIEVLLTKGLEDCRSVDANHLNTENRGRLVHVQGRATGRVPIADAQFQDAVVHDCLKLQSTLEVLQWVPASGLMKDLSGQSRHSLEWSTSYHDSSRFRQPSPQNPRLPTGLHLGTRTTPCSRVKLGAFSLTEAQGLKASPILFFKSLEHQGDGDQQAKMGRIRAGRRRCLGAALLGLGIGVSCQGSFVVPKVSTAPIQGRDVFLSSVAGMSWFGIPAQAQALAEEGDSQLPFFVAGLLVALAGVGALVFGGEAQENVDDKKVVTEYFNNAGFERWQKIYGETDDVNPVQKDIRVGHAETVDKILKWLDPAMVSGKSVCDAGCGTGNLSIPLASRGADVHGSDISSAMVGEAEVRAKETLPAEQMPKFSTSDLEAINGKFDTVCCVDVLIHYPPDKMSGMVQHLAGLSKERLILSFAPKTWYYTLLKRIGELFPGKSKTTRAYLHDEADVEAALKAAGYKVTRKDMTSTNFYFSRLFEAQPVA